MREQEDQTKRDDAPENTQRSLEGCTVYDAAGEELGSIIGGTTDGAYFTLEEGLLFTTDYYVPTSVISRIEGDKAHLKISADEVKSSGWQDPPLGYERGEQFREHLTETPAAQVDEPPR